MKLFLLIFSVLFLRTETQNSCCPGQFDSTEVQCNPADALNCSNGTVFELDRTAFEDENFRPILNGSTLVYGDGTRKESSLNYCLTEAKDKNGTIRELALICTNNDTSVSENEIDWNLEITNSYIESGPKQESIVFHLLECVSMVCFIFTLIIYFIVSKWHNLDYHCVVHFLSNYSIVYFIICILYDSKDSLPVYITKAHLIYFCSISSFCWYNLIIFNLWKELMFWQSSFTKTYLIYVAYAYGIATILTSAGFIIILMTENYDMIDFYTILTDSKLKQRFFYTPIVILLSVNLLPLISSAILIRKNRCSEIQNNSTIQNWLFSFHIYCTLFLLIGLIWLLEILFSDKLPVKSREMLFVIDTLNSLQGILIFILLVVVRKTVHQSLLKHCKLFLSYCWVFAPLPIIPTMEEVQQIEQYLDSNLVRNNVENKKS